jgi:hypothetical protein
MTFRLLDAFRGLFDGVRYLHRKSTLGDFVASHLYEDLVGLGKSAKLIERTAARDRVVNVENRAVGRTARRGDGTFGELVPAVLAIRQNGFVVARGPVANVEIGAETKILAKAMIKQIDRVITDLKNQVVQFKRLGGNPICIGIVGVNSAEHVVSYEGGRRFPTDGKRHKHPIQEAAEAGRRLQSLAAPSFDEFLVLRFRATNVRPYPFTWTDEAQTKLEYGALLTRVSREYDQRF